MYKDRLARFGFELIEYIINETSNGRIVVINNSESNPDEELTKDLVSIINVFSAKLNGMRKYKNKSENKSENKWKISEIYGFIIAVSSPFDIKKFIGF